LKDGETMAFMNTGKKPGFRKPDFSLDIYQQKIPDKGEDAYIYGIGEEKALAAVFDGCGGSGAKIYDNFQGKTGAYMASRVAAGAAKSWFEQLCWEKENETLAGELACFIREYIAICAGQSGKKSGIKGSISREFPTTAAVCACRENEGGIECLSLWAGDSRCYVLGLSGLRQLSLDDLNVTDSMENLSRDAVLTNVISHGRSFDIHAARYLLDEPCIVFAATDGCFGYLPTPMEFEYMLLETLAASESVAEWEERIKSVLLEISGDDFCLCGHAYGFGSFPALKRSFRQRTAELWEKYIENIGDKSLEEKTEMWKEYSISYNMLLKGE